MCGRYSLAAPAEEIAEAFGLPELPPLAPRYNIAPTQGVPVVRSVAGGGRELAEVRWGLIPHWFVEPGSGPPLINARAESVAARPAFRDAFRGQRCVLPASGFYEWQRLERGKQPHYVRRRDGRLLGLAGLWERWVGAGEVLESCTVITVPANDALVGIHDRMPAVLSGEALERWLDPAASGPGELVRLLIPCPSAELDVYPVSPRVNRAENDDAGCVVPLA
jgi:putative SOS response-associated peptidase YedK